MLLLCWSLIGPRVGISSTQSEQNEAILWEMLQTICAELLFSDDDFLICISVAGASCCFLKSLLALHPLYQASVVCGNHCRTSIWMIIYEFLQIAINWVLKWTRRAMNSGDGSCNSPGSTIPATAGRFEIDPCSFCFEEVWKWLISIIFM